MSIATIDFYAILNQLHHYVVYPPQTHIFTPEYSVTFVTLRFEVETQI